MEDTEYEHTIICFCCSSRASALPGRDASCARPTEGLAMPPLHTRVRVYEVYQLCNHVRLPLQRKQQITRLLRNIAPLATIRHTRTYCILRDSNCRPQQDLADVVCNRAPKRSAASNLSRRASTTMIITVKNASSCRKISEPPPRRRRFRIGPLRVTLSHAQNMNM